MRRVEIAVVAWAIFLPSGAVLVGCELDFDKYQSTDAVALDTSRADQGAELDDSSVETGNSVPDGSSVVVEANSRIDDAGEVDAQSPIDVVDALATTTDTTVPVGDATAPVGDATAPVGEATAPVGDATAPVGEATAPVGDATAPVGDVSVADGRVGDARVGLGDASSNAPDGRTADAGTGTGDASWTGADGEAADGRADAEEVVDASEEATACTPSSSCLTGCRDMR